MANKKASELTAFAEQAYKEKWGYVWGGSGEIYTRTVAEKLYKTYGSKTGQYNETYYLTTQMSLWGGRKVCDCSGLLRAFGASGTADSMYTKSTTKGKLATCDLLSGTLIFCQGSDSLMNHVGVLVEGGYVIHSTNSQKGVIKEKLATSTRGWTHWGKAHFIDYSAATSTAPVATSQAEYYTVKAGDTLSKIAVKYCTTLAILQRLNPEIKNLDLINIGQKIKVR